MSKIEFRMLDDTPTFRTRQMHFGSRVLTPGCTAMIPAYTLSSFRAGPDGLRFLNFRARANGVYISKDELMTLRERDRVKEA